jgi:hypothetical protein
MTKFIKLTQANKSKTQFIYVNVAEITFMEPVYTLASELSYTRIEFTTSTSWDVLEHPSQIVEVEEVD